MILKVWYWFRKSLLDILLPIACGTFIYFVAVLDHHPWHHNHQYCLHIHHHQHQRPFWAKNSLHTTASMGMVVKTPFYTWCPDDYILHLVSFHDHGHDHHAVTVIIITAVVTLHVGRQCSHPCRGRSLHSGDAAIKQPRHRRQQHKRQHDININTRVFITKVNLKQKLNNPWVTSSTCPHKSCCSSRTIPDEEEDKAENKEGGVFQGDLKW